MLTIGEIIASPPARPPTLTIGELLDAAGHELHRRVVRGVQRIARAVRRLGASAASAASLATPRGPPLAVSA